MFYETVDTIHLEITDKCNATCPMCARNKNGGDVNQHLPLTELTLEDIKSMFHPGFVTQLKHMYMCGNYGDPIVAQDTLEVFKYFREHNRDMYLSMNTNASARTPEWWAELAKVFGSKGSVTFSVDGLGDTNHLYRKGTNFDKIMANAKAFINAGGRARWDFIVFQHNEHQVNAAKILADTIGFERFTLKKSGRFFSVENMVKREYREVLKKDGSLDYRIYPPNNPDLQNQSLKKEQSIIEHYGSMEDYLDKTPISCQVQDEGSVYVSAEGLVFPCCWTANQMYNTWWKDVPKNEITDLVEKHGIETINAKTRNIKDIVDGPFFEDIKQSWSCPSREDGKLAICSRICGEKFNQFKDQFK